MAAFDPTGHTLATAFQDGTVLLWDVDPASWLKRACAVAGRRLTQQEWQEFLPGGPTSPPVAPRDVSASDSRTAPTDLLLGRQVH